MRSPLAFLKFVAKAVLNAVGGGMVGDLAFEVLPDVAKDVWGLWAKDRPEDQLRAEVQEVAQLPAAEALQQAEAIAAQEAAGHPENVYKTLTAYLTQVPTAIRQSQRRPADPTGRTVSSALPLRKPSDLLTLLPARMPRFQPGDRPAGIGDWELEELLGAGGFGEVWKARNPHFDGVLPVALKFCLDPAAKNRLLRYEATVLNEVMRAGRHPGIVQLQQSFLSADPPCLAYEYVAGGDLATLIQEWHGIRGGAPPRQAASLVRDLAQIVGFAHRLHPPVVHRDLKPANILVERLPEGKVAFRVADFGIGGVAAGQAIEQTRQGTTRGQFLCSAVRGAYTPLYCSPQQMRGDPPDPRDDVHALGVIWYQLLVGDPTAAVGADWHDELAARHVPPEMMSWLGGCLAGRAERRPADAGILADELDKLLRLPQPGGRRGRIDPGSLAAKLLAVLTDKPQRVAAIKRAAGTKSGYNCLKKLAEQGRVVKTADGYALPAAREATNRAGDSTTAGSEQPQTTQPLPPPGKVQAPCPQCRTLLKIPANLPAGQKVRCPKCKTVFVATPPPVSGRSNKEQVYRLWEQNPEVSPDTCFQHVQKRVKLSTIRGWISGWKRDTGLPHCAKKDPFGCREGSQAAAINAKLSSEPKTAEAIAEETGLSVGRVRDHFRYWLKKGRGLGLFLVETENGWRVNDSITPGRPGVIDSIAEFLLAASETEPVTKEALRGKVLERFPGRDPEKTMSTINTQMSGRLQSERGLKIEKNDKGGYWARKGETIEKERVGRDRFGSRLGTVRAIFNAPLSTTPKTSKVVAEETGYPPSRVEAYFRDLMQRRPDLIFQTDDGYAVKEKPVTNKFIGGDEEGKAIVRVNNRGDGTKNEPVARDRFGSRIGSNAAKFNAVLSEKPQTMAEMVEKAGIPSTKYQHTKKLIKRGLVAKTEDGKYVLKAESLDKFGSRIGSSNAKVNAVLSTLPKTFAQIAQETGLTDKQVRYKHLNDLVARGLVVKEGGAFRLASPTTDS